jgi:thymidylate synthase
VTASFALETDKKDMCFVLKGRKWVAVDPYESSSSSSSSSSFQYHLGPASSSSSSSSSLSSSSHRVEVGGIFRLIPNPKSNTVMMMTLPQPGVQFTLCCSRQLPSVNPVGTASFDQQYLKLLQHINNYGKLQRNEKGENWTLSDSYSFVVDLRGGGHKNNNNNNNKNLLPLTTLRKMFNGRAAVIEALWYLRGEDHIRFLQDFRQHFWDKQADQDTGWVGYNYGLLTNYENFNQLEVNVIRRLVQNKSSRNMVCSLVNPNQATVQNACTSAVQFAVSHQDGQDYLDLTVEQRSSDIILGLPHDVVVWTVILHLVRREVHRRSGPHLHAGRLFFNIAAGGAHVYILNQDAFVTLLSRRPKPIIITQ